MKGIAFIRNSDVRYDTRLRKAMSESVECGFSSIFFGWIRDGGSQPDKQQYINEKQISTTYFLSEAKFGVGFRNIFRLFAFNLWLLKKIIEKRKSYNAIYVCDLDVAVPALLAKILFKKKIIYDIFDFYAHTHSMHKQIRKIVESIEYCVCRFADQVIVCTEKRAETLFKKTNVIPIIIYNTPNFPATVSDNHNENPIQKKFSIVYVGTLPEKSRLLQEITELIKLNPDIDFHVAGSGPLREYFEDAAKSYSNIFFHGLITNDVALKLQSRADILFATYDPSLEINRNSAPNKVYEAMALGKPIIVCKNTDADDIITKNCCGYSIKYDANEFMSVIRIYEDNFQLRDLHGKNGRKLYDSVYHWDVCSDRLRKIFSSV
jgi:glycosyltransferase involved in cell wall biosynthesis